MKQVLNGAVFCLMVGLMFSISCQKELACYTCNKPPVANAGTDKKVVVPIDMINLDGSASTDSDGQIKGWLWTKVAGPAAFSIVNSTSSSTQVKSLVAGIYSFELKVTDDRGAFARDTVTIIVDNPLVNQPPIANAGPDQLVTLPVDSSILDGSKSIDPDNNITAYSWRRISPTPSKIVNVNAAQTRLINLEQGIHEFELLVVDAGGLSALDTVKVAVSSASGQPNANAGPDQIIMLPTSSIRLDGSKSTDPDNNIITYNWSKISGSSTVIFANSNNVITQVSNLNEGVYQFELKVTDAVGLVSKDTVKATVKAAITVMNCGETNRPIINAKLVPFAKLSEPSAGMAVASDGKKIAFAGASLAGSPPTYGSSKVHILDIGTQTWSIAALSSSRADVAAVAAGNKLFFAGGRLGNGLAYDYSSIVDIYDVSTNKWSVANLSQARAYAAAATLGDKVFFAGGEQEWPKPVSDRVDIYDLKTDVWSIANLSVQRNGLATVTAGQKVYFAGGANQIGGNNVSDIIDVYDNISNTWSTTNLSEPKAFFAGINVYNKIYWAGGDGAAGIPSCQVEINDLGTQTSSGASLFNPFSYVTHEGLNPVVKNNKIIWFATLDPSSGNSTDKFNIYDITTNTWSIGLLPFRMNGASVMAINNIVYIAGGYINGRMSDQVWTLEF